MASVSVFLALVEDSVIDLDDSERDFNSAKGTRAAFERRVDFEEGEDGGVFSGLATTTLCFDVVKDLVGVLGASSKALTNIDMREKLGVSYVGHQKNHFSPLRVQRRDMEDAHGRHFLSQFSGHLIR